MRLVGGSRAGAVSHRSRVAGRVRVAPAIHDRVAALSRSLADLSERRAPPAKQLLQARCCHQIMGVTDRAWRSPCWWCRTAGGCGCMRPVEHAGTRGPGDGIETSWVRAQPVGNGDRRVRASANGLERHDMPRRGMVAATRLQRAGSNRTCCRPCLTICLTSSTSRTPSPDFCE